MDNYAILRKNMVEKQIIARGVKDKRVLKAMLTVQRHEFVDENLKNSAYEDYPLPIGENQTISQPYIVAFMSEALELKQDEKVLEIGTGCGYQTAILSLLSKEVYTIERISSLQQRAKNTLLRLGYTNIKYKLGNGIKGWSEFAPYQAIIVTAAAQSIPKALLEQLDTQGRLVIPVDNNEDILFKSQTLKKIIKKKNGKIEEKPLLGCRFVPLIG